jgi:hypothetical protein
MSSGCYDTLRRWQLLAEEARDVAREMKDPQCLRVMRQIVEGYELLAARARNRALDSKPGRVGNKTDAPQLDELNDQYLTR